MENEATDFAVLEGPGASVHLGLEAGGDDSDGDSSCESSSLVEEPLSVSPGER